jgi:hypothetical protein
MTKPWGNLALRRFEEELSAIMIGAVRYHSGTNAADSVCKFEVSADSSTFGTSGAGEMSQTPWISRAMSGIHYLIRTDQINGHHKFCHIPSSRGPDFG